MTAQSRLQLQHAWIYYEYIQVGQLAYFPIKNYLVQHRNAKTSQRPFYFESTKRNIHVALRSWRLCLAVGRWSWSKNTVQ